MKKENTGRFVLQEHHAKNLHYDFRLEIGGVLKSWAVPKNLPFKKGIKRLALAVEDHPLDYLKFEGKIPNGQYGAGEVLIYDSGYYNLIESSGNKMSFELFGEKYKGLYKLIFLKENQWLVFKG